MEGKDLIEILSKLDREIPKNRCYGVRVENGEIVFFYHPYGCESEMKTSDPDELLKWTIIR